MQERRKQEAELASFDDAWGDLMGELDFRAPGKDPNAKWMRNSGDGVDDYDKSMRTLGRESAARASDRLKTKEELQAGRKAQLEKLEAERLERAKKSLRYMGPAVLKGGFSTFLSFILLANSNSHVFETFFKVSLIKVPRGHSITTWTRKMSVSTLRV